MKSDSLTAISPLDGRYCEKVNVMSEYFSEWALFKYRIMVEVEYFIALTQANISQLKKLNIKEISTLKKLYLDFDFQGAKRIKKIEETTNHDVKAVEYYIKECLKGSSLEKRLEFIHFGLTSQDINNTATPLMIKDAVKHKFIPELSGVISNLKKLSKKYKNISMLARTHGQPASPTTLGKELFVFVNRLEIQMNTLKQFEYVGKFGGATGHFNAHHVAYPNIKWDKFSDKLLKKMGLARNQVTTQIDSYDNLAELFGLMRRINVVLIDLNRDIWQYISQNYFLQKTKAGEIGSSAMPHKVNPIDFENSEGNLSFANAIFDYLANKLPVSRLQRDLTDSTVLRNVGVPIAHSYLAFQSLQKGLDKLNVNKKVIKADLNGHYEVVAEAIQTVLRREGYAMPYEALKALTRGKKVTKASIDEFIEGLDVQNGIKEELKKITPENYIGISSELVE